MKKGESKHLDALNGYVKGVISGEIPAGKWVILACERHLADLKRSKDKAWPYRFDGEKSARACKFISLLPHVKGKWALGSKPQRMEMQPWQCFMVGSMFGWVNKTTGKRRFRKVRLYVPRKNGKSSLAAPIGLYMLAADGEPGAEVYSGATTEKQAWEVFGPARQMALKTPDLLQAFGIEVNAKSLTRLEDMSKFEPLIGKPGDGSSPHCAIIDEYHEHQTDDALATMETGMGAREQPMSLVISTAGDNVAGPCRDDWLECQKVLERVMEDDRLFALIYACDTDRYDVKIQSTSAIGILERDCTCNFVSNIQAVRLLAEECAAHATRNGGGLAALANAATTLIETLEREGYAEAAMSSSCLIEIQKESASQSPSEKSGHQGTKKKQKQAALNGLQSPDQSKNLKSRGSKSFTESTRKSTKNYSNISKADAEFVKGNIKFSAWITATIQALYGDCFAENAILESAFWGILKKIYNAHSNTCAIQEHRISADGLIVTISPDDWTSETALRKANPNYGVSVEGEFLLAQQRDAINNPRKQGHFKTKHLNLWVQARDAFINMQRWAECQAPLKLEGFNGQECWIGLDLASKVDIAAVELLFRHGDGFARFGRYYLPEETVNLPENQHYRAWHQQGLLTVTDGNIIDFNEIFEDILGFCSRFTVQDVAYDPHQATMLVTNLQAEGIPVVEFKPTVLNFSEPMKQIEALIRDRKLKHDGDPVMTWMMSNVVAKVDAKDNVYPRKERPENKIDGFVALCSAMGRAMASNGQDSHAFNEFLMNPVIK